MSDRLKAWDEVLRCLDALSNATKIAPRCEAKENIIEASWEALTDSIEYKLLKDQKKQKS